MTATPSPLSRAMTAEFVRLNRLLAGKPVHEDADVAPARGDVTPPRPSYSPDLTGIADLIANQTSDIYGQEVAVYLATVAETHAEDGAPTGWPGCTACSTPRLCVQWPCPAYVRAERVGVAWLIGKVTG